MLLREDKKHLHNNYYALELYNNSKSELGYHIQYREAIPYIDRPVIQYCGKIYKIDNEIHWETTLDIDTIEEIKKLFLDLLEEDNN